MGLINYNVAVTQLRTMGWTVGPRGCNVTEGQIIAAIRTYGLLGAVETLDNTLRFVARGN